MHLLLRWKEVILMNNETRIDTEKLQEAYVQGRDAMSKQMDALKEFLNK